MKRQQVRTEGKKVRVVIVDDHPIVRQGLAGLIEHEDDLMVCGEAGDAHQAMKIIEKSEPDIAIIDIALKDSSGIELIKDIKVRYPALPLLVLSMHDESLYAERALRAGAKGYVMKQRGTDKVIFAIRKIMSGQVYVSDRMASKMVRKLVGGKPEVGASPIDCLSDRELEVFLLIGQGHGTRQISEQLHLSVKTIETYRSHIKEKLNLYDAAELLQYAIQWVNS
ncbi:MAG: response regulator transcription factor [Planctomycetota bacterium]